MSEPIRTSVSTAAWLDWITNLMGTSRQSHAATFPADRYFCLLDELPLHLVPLAARARLHSYDERETAPVLNPECLFSYGESLPQDLSALKELTSGFALRGTIAWVRDPAMGSFHPFWLGPRLEGAVGRLRRKETASQLDSRERALLVQAGILKSPESDGMQASSRGHFEQAARRFQEKEYAPLVGLIHPFEVAALRRYYRYLIRRGAISLGDGQSSRRYVAHNEPVARFFHNRIARVLSMIAGEHLKPSYVYLASYQEGAELKKHTDREQCDFSVTLCLDFSPEPVHETLWPIRLETSSGDVVVYQALGEGLAYRGTRLPHYRSPLGKGQTSTSIFFHYVRADFSGPLD
ncbi:MAG TPA: hypothetical protein VMH04_15855 [Candidatus Solibacter sp.]|nr:hypothetical protein [Candidatus Solibacter sp.]